MRIIDRERRLQHRLGEIRARMRLVCLLWLEYALLSRLWRKHALFRGRLLEAPRLGAVELRAVIGTRAVIEVRRGRPGCIIADALAKPPA